MGETIRQCYMNSLQHAQFSKVIPLLNPRLRIHRFPRYRLPLRGRRRRRRLHLMQPRLIPSKLRISLRRGRVMLRHGLVVLDESVVAREFSLVHDSVLRGGVVLLR